VRVVGVGGEPWVGKSTFLSRVVAGWGRARSQRLSVLRLLEYPAVQCSILGVLKGGRFQGSDAVAGDSKPEALALVRAWSKLPERSGWSLWFEGGKLFERGFLSACEQVAECRWLVLYADPDTVAERRAAAGVVNDPAWLSSRRSSVPAVLAKHRVEFLGCNAVPDLPAWVPVARAA
jgi:hypothetical protein